MLNIINNLVGLTLGQPQIPTNIYWGFFMPTYTTIYKRRVNIKYPNTHRSYQHINNWTNVGPTLHTSTQHKVANFHVNISSLDQRWANIICPTRYWPRFMPTFTTMDQHCIPNTDGQAFLPTYHPLDHFINVGPTFKLRRQQSTNHSTNNQRRPAAVFLSWMSTDKNRVHYFEAKLLHPCARFNLFLSKWL